MYIVNIMAFSYETIKKVKFVNVMKLFRYINVPFTGKDIKNSRTHKKVDPFEHV